MRINSFQFLLSTLFLSVVVSGYPFNSSQQDSDALGYQDWYCDATPVFERVRKLFKALPSTVQELNYTQSLELAKSVTKLYFRSNCKCPLYTSFFGGVSYVKVDDILKLKIVNEMLNNIPMISSALTSSGDSLYDVLVTYGSLVYSSSKTSFEKFDYRFAPMQSLICAQLVPIANVAVKIRKSNNTDAVNLLTSSVDLCSSGLNQAEKGYMSVVDTATMDTKCTGIAPALLNCVVTTKFTADDTFKYKNPCIKSCRYQCNQEALKSTYLLNPIIASHSKVFNGGYCRMREKIGLFDDFNSIEAVECADQINYFYAEHHFIDNKWYARRKPGGPLVSYIEKNRGPEGIGLYDNGAGDNIFIFTNQSKVLSDKEGLICIWAKFYNRCQLNLPPFYGPCYAPR